MSVTAPRFRTSRPSASPRSPDEIAANITFPRLDLNGLLRVGSGGGATYADIPLDVARSPDPLIDAHLAARPLVDNGIHGSDVTLSAAVTHGQIVVRALALTYLGASIRAEGRLDAADKIGLVSAKVVVSGGWQATAVALQWLSGNL
jgi:AsmA family protein